MEKSWQLGQESGIRIDYSGVYNQKRSQSAETRISHKGIEIESSSHLVPEALVQRRQIQYSMGPNTSTTRVQLPYRERNTKLVRQNEIVCLPACIGGCK